MDILSSRWIVECTDRGAKKRWPRCYYE